MRMRLRPCGGAPPELLPFKLEQSPWDQAPFANLIPSASVGGQASAALLSTELVPESSLETEGSIEEEAEEEGEEDMEAETSSEMNAGESKQEEENITEEGTTEEEATEDEEEAQHRRRLQGFAMQTVGCKKKVQKIYFENDGPGPVVAKKVAPTEKSLVRCMTDITQCDMDAYRAAQKTSSIRRLRALEVSTQAQAEVGGKRRFRTCAIVGNSGHILKTKLGEYIDKHEAIIRFNVMSVAGFTEHVGSKTTFRVLNHQRSTTGCCRGKLPENKTNSDPISVVLWHSGGQEEIATACRGHYPDNKVIGLSRGFVLKEVSVMRSLRMDVQRLGFGPLGSWRQLTSGAHAMLLFERLCDTISVYGISAYGFKGIDQYAGRDKRSTGGRQWHDWKGESLVYRLLHASGRVALCTV